MRTFVFLILIFVFFSSRDYAQSDINNWKAEVYYVKTGNLNIRSKPSSRARKVGAFKRYQKIVAIISGEKSGKWLKIIYPKQGYVYKKYLIPAENFDVNPRRISKTVKRLNNYFVEEIEYPETEFTVENKENSNINLDEVEKFLLLHKTNLTKIIYPFEGKLETPAEEIAASDYVIPKVEDNNWTYEERHVRAYYLNLRERPSERAPIITALNKNQKIVLIDIADEKITPGWGHVLYPIEGYVYKKYLYRHVADSSALENDWKAVLAQNGDFPFVVYADSNLTVPSDTLRPNRTYLTVVRKGGNKITEIIFPVHGFANPEETVIANFDEEEKAPGWNFEERYVKASFLNVRKRPSQHADIISVVKKFQKVLILNTDEKITRGWKETLYPIRGYLYAPYLYGKKEESEIADEIYLPENAWSAVILPCAADSAYIYKSYDDENTILGTIHKNEQAIFIVDSLDESDWIYEVFPKQGYVKADNLGYTKKSGGRAYIGAGILVGPYQLPVEKNLSNHKMPFGAVFDYSRTNWRLAFRLGFFQTQTHSENFVLKTNQVFLTARYSFLRLLDNSLDVYAGAGLNYWMSDFKYSKENFENYYEDMSDSDFGYSLSAGIIYTFSDFFIDMQYYFWSSREAEFENRNPSGDFTDKFGLYPGSNQFHVIIGYKFKL